MATCDAFYFPIGSFLESKKSKNVFILRCVCLFVDGEVYPQYLFRWFMNSGGSRALVYGKKGKLCSFIDWGIGFELLPQFCY